MCITVAIQRSDGEYEAVQTCGQARALLRNGIVRWLPADTPAHAMHPADDECLCTVDLSFTASRNARFAVPGGSMGVDVAMPLLD